MNYYVKFHTNRVNHTPNNSLINPINYSLKQYSKKKHIPEHLRTSLFGLLLVNMFHQGLLIFEPISLSFKVESVVHVFIDLLGFPIFAKKTTKNSHPSHPDDFLRHTSVCCTLSLTWKIKN